MKKVLNILKENQGSFVSGKNIGEILGISRMAVNKKINQLKNQGYEIESLTKKGYKLSKELDIIDIDFIRTNLNYEHSLEYFDTIGSTNTYIKENLDKLSFGHIVIANEQTKGRGRQNRKFISNKNAGIYMSILINPNCSIEDSLKITLLTSVAVFSSIKKNYDLEIGLKWVNDLILNNLKIGGILCEAEIELNNRELSNMVIGVGVNVKNTIFPDELKDIATSIENHSSKNISRNQLIVDIINYFDMYFKENADYMKIYKNNFILKNKEIEVFKNNTSFYANAIDVDKDGSLIISANNEIIKINSGEVSIRKKQLF